jgi:hypothetical protein
MQNRAQETPVQIPTRTSRLSDEIEVTRELIGASAALLAESAVLCEKSSDLRHDNADLRDFLRESRLKMYSRRERSEWVRLHA